MKKLIIDVILGKYSGIKRCEGEKRNVVSGADYRVIKRRLLRRSGQPNKRWESSRTQR